MKVLVGLLLAEVLSSLHVQHVEGQAKAVCNPTDCILPDCRCLSHRIPNDLDVDEIPQLILFSFNGPVTANGSKYVMEMFHRRIRNPNRTPIRATFFVTDDAEKTDYCIVHNLWAYGHEIASFGVNRRTPEWWASASQGDWENEIEAQKEYIISNASIPAAQVWGFRSPHLQTGGNAQYKFAVDKNYTYDSSIILPTLCPDRDAGLCPRLWPFTMDYPIDRTRYPCHREPCPDGEFPGLWQIPVQPLLDMNNSSCIYIDKCTNAPPQNAEEVHNMLMKNFRLHYEDNRAHLLINLFDYEDWFKENPWALEGVDRFISTALNIEWRKVWFITYNDLIGWMKTPQTRYLRYFGPFDRNRQQIIDCEEKSSVSCVSALHGLEILITAIAVIYLCV